jgi:hypothetical protein
MMQAKMRVTEVQKYPTNQIVKMTAVGKSDGYPDDGADENNSYARWTPSADLSISIANPALFDKFSEGQQFYLDFTEA